MEKINEKIQKHHSDSNSDEQGNYLFEAFIIAYRMRAYNSNAYEEILELMREFCKNNGVDKKAFEYFMEDLKVKFH